MELAGYFAAHAVWCVAEGETLIPLVAFQREGGEQHFRRLEAERLEDAVAQGKKWLEENPEGVSCATLVYDAFVSLESGKTDCLMLEVREYRPTLWSLSIALPYRHASTVGGFAVHRPKFISTPGSERNPVSLGEAFFSGVAQHEKGAAVWNAHLEETL